MLLLRSRRRRGWWGRGVSLDGWGWVVIVILWFGLWLLVVPMLRAFLFGFLGEKWVSMGVSRWRCGDWKGREARDWCVDWMLR